MKRLSLGIAAIAFLVALLAGLGSSSFAQETDNPFNGSWKLDTSTIRYDGPSFSVDVTPAGFTVTRMGTALPAVVCDNQPHDTSGGYTSTCVKSKAGYLITNAKDGKTTSKVTLTVSKTTLTRRQDFTPSDDAPYSITVTSKRVSGGPGLAGEWKQVDVQESMVDPMTIAIHGDSIDFKETDQSKPSTIKLDGTALQMPGGGTIAVRLADPHTLRVVYSGADGKVRRENTFALSLDGKTISETDFTPDPGPSTETMLLHKI